MSEKDNLREAIDEVLRSGGVVPVGRVVLCDFCDEDLTEDTRSGGFLFQSKAVGPCCAEKSLVSIRGYGEERFIRGRCPEGVSFADWVRGLRGPDAAVRVSRSISAIRAMGGDAS